MAQVPPRSAYEYRELASLEEVNALTADGFELFQAVAVGDALRYLVRKVKDSEEARRAGFTPPA